jgi:Tol biopolymer transport system component
MRPDRWREITGVFHAAIAHDTTARETFLNEACKHDPSLRAEVDVLVAAHLDAGSFGQHPLLAIPREVMRLEPGTRLGAFRIEALLGVGGMGEVYRALDTQLGRAVAIKVLPDSVARDPDRLARLEREARVLASLNHPHIAAIYGIEKADGVRALILELVEGETLADRLSGAGALRLDEALPIAKQIAEALEAAHEKGIIHRDLKPANIALTGGGLVKVLDFGLAKAFASEGSDLTQPTVGSDRTGEGTIVGTPAYMSPEQARGLTVDKRTDIWAFGCVLYELLTGRRAFSGATFTDTLAAIIEREPDWTALPPATPVYVERLLRRTLQKNTALRLRDIGDARIELLSGVEDDQVRPGVRDAPSRRALYLALVAAGVLAGAMFFVGWQSATAPQDERQTAAPPTFRQLTFRRGSISMARFAPDGRTVVYSASWDGQAHELYAGGLDGPESRPLGWPAGVLFAVSPTNEVALSLDCSSDPVSPGCSGTLATAPLAGGAPRALATDITFADWGRNGELAVVRTQGLVSRLEFPRGRVVYEARRITSLRVDPQGQRVAIVSAPAPTGGGGPVDVLVIERDGTSRTLVSGRQWVNGLAWSPSGDQLWFSAIQDKVATLHAVTLNGRERSVLTLPGSHRLHDIGPDGSVLLSTVSTRNVTMFKRPDQDTEQPFSWFDEGWAVGLSADGQLVLFNERGRAVGGKPTMYLRPTDGKSAPVRLGEGAALGLSHDAAFVLAVRSVSGQQQLTVVPTGPGDPLVLPRGSVETYEEGYGSFSLDGRRVLFHGWRRGEGLRAFVQELAAGEPRAITPDLSYNGLGHISPDGQWVAETTGAPGQYVHMLYPLAGGAPRPIPGARPELTPMQWTADGSALFMRTWTPFTTELETSVFRVSLRTGAQTLWRKIRAADLAGAGFPRGVMITPDGRAYTYNYVQSLQDLYVATGLK